MTACPTPLPRDVAARPRWCWDVLAPQVSDGGSGAGLDVLDVGGGTGGFAVPLAGLGHQVTVVDPSPDALAALRAPGRRGRRRASRAVQGDAAGLLEVVEPGSADLVLCHGVLEHVDDLAPRRRRRRRGAAPRRHAQPARRPPHRGRARPGARRPVRRGRSTPSSDPDGRWGPGDPMPRRFTEPSLLAPARRRPGCTVDDGARRAHLRRPGPRRPRRLRARRRRGAASRSRPPPPHHAGLPGRRDPAARPRDAILSRCTAADRRRARTADGDEPQPAAAPTRTAVRAARRRRRLHRPARRHGRVLRLGRAARPARAARHAGDRRRRARAAWCSSATYEARALRRALGDADDPGPAAVPAGDRGPSPTTARTPRSPPASWRSSASITPLVEPLSLDEAFLDVAGRACAGSAARPRSAQLIRDRVADEQGITCSVGVAPHQVRRQARLRPGASPTACSSSRADEVVAFLHPLPVGALWGVGEKTEEALHPARAAHRRRHRAHAGATLRAGARPGRRAAPARAGLGPGRAPGGRRTSRTRASAPRRPSPATSTTPTSIRRELLRLSRADGGPAAGGRAGRPHGQRSRSGSPTSPRSPGPAPCASPPTSPRSSTPPPAQLYDALGPRPGPDPAGRRPGRGPRRRRARPAPAAARRPGIRLARGRAGRRPGGPPVRLRRASGPAAWSTRDGPTDGLLRTPRDDSCRSSTSRSGQRVSPSGFHHALRAHILEMRTVA